MKGLAIIDARVVLARDFFLNLIFLRGEIFCSGIFIFCFILIIKLLAPNNPVRSGRSGSLRFRFKDAIPKNPAKRNIIKAQSLFFGSLIIRYTDIRIKIIGMVF